MTKQEAMKKLNQKHGFWFPVQMEEYYAFVRIRHKNVMLPEFGVDGSYRDDAEWAFIDMTEKIDTGIYGAVYYI